MAPIKGVVRQKLLWLPLIPQGVLEEKGESPKLGRKPDDEEICQCWEGGVLQVAEKGALCRWSIDLGRRVR